MQDMSRRESQVVVRSSEKLYSKSGHGETDLV